MKLSMLLDDITYEILNSLRTREYYVRELISELKRNPNAIIKRLRILEEHGIIKSVVEEKRRRRKVMFLTEKGYKILAMIDEIEKIY